MSSQAAEVGNNIITDEGETEPEDGENVGFDDSWDSGDVSGLWHRVRDTERRLRRGDAGALDRLAAEIQRERRMAPDPGMFNLSRDDTRRARRARRNIIESDSDSEYERPERPPRRRRIVESEDETPEVVAAPTPTFAPETPALNIDEPADEEQITEFINDVATVQPQEVQAEIVEAVAERGIDMADVQDVVTTLVDAVAELEPALEAEAVAVLETPLEAPLPPVNVPRVRGVRRQLRNLAIAAIGVAGVWTAGMNRSTFVTPPTQRSGTRRSAARQENNAERQQAIEEIRRIASSAMEEILSLQASLDGPDISELVNEFDLALETYRESEFHPTPEGLPVPYELRVRAIESGYDMATAQLAWESNDFPRRYVETQAFIPGTPAHQTMETFNTLHENAVAHAMGNIPAPIDLQANGFGDLMPLIQELVSLPPSAARAPAQTLAGTIMGAASRVSRGDLDLNSYRAAVYQVGEWAREMQQFATQINVATNVDMGPEPEPLPMEDEPVITAEEPPPPADEHDLPLEPVLPPRYLPEEPEEEPSPEQQAIELETMVDQLPPSLRASVRHDLETVENPVDRQLIVGRVLHLLSRAVTPGGTNSLIRTARDLGLTTTALLLASAGNAAISGSDAASAKLAGTGLRYSQVARGRRTTDYHQQQRRDWLRWQQQRDTIASPKAPRAIRSVRWWDSPYSRPTY